MSRKVRCVFDTNNLISAILLKDSIPGQAFYSALSQGTILISLETIEELVELIYRSKFDRYVTLEEREEFLTSLVARAVFIEVLEEQKVCRDPKDDKFLNLSLSGAADYIVTGDEDLLVLATYRNVKIVSAKDFLAQISKLP